MESTRMATGTCATAVHGVQRSARKSTPTFGLVTGSVFLGNCVEVFVRLESGEDVVAQAPRGSSVLQPGQAVQVCWDAAEEMKFS